MKLAKYEIQALELLLKQSLSNEGWDQFLANNEVLDFEYTGAGYFLKIYSKGLNQNKRTIHKPVVMGLNSDFDVGFILYLESDEVTLECHSWSDKNPPKNVRELKIEITVSNDLTTKAKNELGGGYAPRRAF